MSPLQLYAAAMSGILICTASAASSPLQNPFRRTGQTYYGPTETLDPLYRPRIRVAESYRGHFRPTRVTDETGALAEDLAEDLG